jgi:hypothetical protein
VPSFSQLSALQLALNNEKVLKTQLMQFLLFSAARQEVPAMNVRVEVVCVSADGREQRRDVLAIDRQELTMETLGVSRAESEGVQKFMIVQQVSEDLVQDCSEHLLENQKAVSSCLLSRGAARSDSLLILKFSR